MNALFDKGKVFFSKFDSQIIRLLVTIGTLIMFVLAAGAPGGLGGVGM